MEHSGSFLADLAGFFFFLAQILIVLLPSICGIAEALYDSYELYRAFVSFGALFAPFYSMLPSRLTMLEMCHFVSALYLIAELSGVFRFRFKSDKGSLWMRYHYRPNNFGLIIPLFMLYAAVFNAVFMRLHHHLHTRTHVD